MGARAIWKGVLSFEGIEVPVKLYSAVEDRNIRFRLLHGKDKSPVKQAMVNPRNESVVPYQETRRVYRTDEGTAVFISQEELDELKPERSRIIDVLSFLPKKVINHRWYDRPYYLGPDGSNDAYFALSHTLENSGREGLAHWVMRNKEYFGALRMFSGYPMLMSLRYREEVVPASELDSPRGKALDKKELSMARQLIGMLEARFEPTTYQDEYRHRVMQLIDRKRKGGRLRRPARPKKKSTGTTADALEASLKGAKSG